MRIMHSRPVVRSKKEEVPMLPEQIEALLEKAKHGNMPPEDYAFVKELVLPALKNAKAKEASERAEQEAELKKIEQMVADYFSHHLRRFNNLIIDEVI